MMVIIKTQRGIKKFNSKRLKPWVHTFAVMLTATGAASLTAYCINYGVMQSTGTHPAVFIVPVYTVVALATGWMIRKWSEDARKERAKERKAQKYMADKRMSGVDER